MNKEQEVVMLFNKLQNALVEYEELKTMIKYYKQRLGYLGISLKGNKRK